MGFQVRGVKGNGKTKINIDKRGGRDLGNFHVRDGKITIFWATVMY